MKDRDYTDLSYKISARFEKINTLYITKMGEQLKEIGTLTPSDIRKLQQFIKMNQNINEIKTLLLQVSQMTLDELDNVFNKAGLDVYKDATIFYTASGITQIPFSDNLWMQRHIRTVSELTAHTFENLARTTVIDKTYKDVIDLACDTAISGVDNYNNVIRTAAVKAATNGLRVTYASGKTRRLDSAIRMNVLEGIRQVNNGVRQQAGKEFGADGVEISVHALCAPDHVDYQGKQFSNKQFLKLQTEILKRPISTCNCKHITFPIIMGVSTPAYTKQELKQYKANSEKLVTINGKTMTKYQATQVQRNIETKIRYAKDEHTLAKSLGDEQLIKSSKDKIARLKKTYTSVSNQAGLTPKWNRT